MEGPYAHSPQATGSQLALNQAMAHKTKPVADVAYLVGQASTFSDGMGARAQRVKLGLAGGGWVGGGQ